MTTKNTEAAFLSKIIEALKKLYPKGDTQGELAKETARSILDPLVARVGNYHAVEGDQKRDEDAFILDTAHRFLSPSLAMEASSFVLRHLPAYARGETAPFDRDKTTASTLYSIALDHKDIVETVNFGQRDMVLHYADLVEEKTLIGCAIASEYFGSDIVTGTLFVEKYLLPAVECKGATFKRHDGDPYFLLGTPVASAVLDVASKYVEGLKKMPLPEAHSYAKEFGHWVALCHKQEKNHHKMSPASHSVAMGEPR